MNLFQLRFSRFNFFSLSNMGEYTPFILTRKEKLSHIKLEYTNINYRQMCHKKKPISQSILYSFFFKEEELYLVYLSMQTELQTKIQLTIRVAKVHLWITTSYHTLTCPYQILVIAVFLTNRKIRIFLANTRIIHLALSSTFFLLFFSSFVVQQMGYHVRCFQYFSEGIWSKIRKDNDERNEEK